MEEKTVEQFYVELMEAARQSGNIQISSLTAAMFKTTLQMDADLSELFSLFECTYNNEQMDNLTTRLNKLYLPFREAVFQEIGLYIGDNSFQFKDFKGL